MNLEHSSIQRTWREHSESDMCQDRSKEQLSAFLEPKYLVLVSLSLYFHVVFTILFIFKNLSSHSSLFVVQNGISFI